MSSNKKRQLNTLENFLVKKHKTETNQLAKIDHDNEILSVKPSTSESAMLVDNTVSDQDISVYDIANYINSKEKAYDVIPNIWTPLPNFKFPTSVGKRNLKCQYNWFHRWNWLSYSKKQDAVYCKYCVFYAETGGIGSQSLGKLVKRPFNNWKDAVEVFNKHQLNEYHKFSLIKYSNQGLINQNKQIPVNLQIDTVSRNNIAENRKKIMPIIDTIILCGRQGISLRGHDDSGPIDSTDNPIKNEGNFRAILRTKLKSGDEILKLHLQTMSKTATYLSPTIQNEVITICGRIIVQKIISRLQQAKFFSILADESTDISNIEQLSLCVRFFNKENRKIEEHFLGFVPVTNLSGQGLANTILETLENFSIDSSFLVGQGYDGASAMSGVIRGVQARIREKYSRALFVHCSSHSLNLAISDACDIPHIRNCMGTIGKVSSFLNTPKRYNVFQSHIDKLTLETKKGKLKKLCQTRWVERHDAILTFLELQNVTTATLLEIHTWRDKESSSEAFSLLKAIQAPEFQLSLHILGKIFPVTLPLSKQLQSTNLDLGKALELATDVCKHLESIRKNAEVEFASIFEKAKTFCADINVEIVIPRITSRQTQRSNVCAGSPEEYFRIAYFIPFVDGSVLHIKERLLKHKTVIQGFDVLMPNKIFNEDELKKIYDFYEHFLEAYSFEVVLGEVILWRQHIENLNAPALDALNLLTFIYENDKDLCFPNVLIFLQIYVTIPVTTASNERTFSTLRRIKTYLRNTLSENRLNGLSLLNIHREVPISSEEVVDQIAKSQRKILLV